MTQTTGFRRGAIALLLIFCSCTTATDRWTYDQTVTSHSEYNSGRLCYKQKTFLPGMELELLKGSSGLQCYLITRGRLFQTTEDSSSKTAIAITIEEQEYPTSAYHLKGGQKLLLEKKDAQKIVEALLSDTTVTITTRRYQTEVFPDQFKQKYRKLTKLKATS